MEQHIIDNLKSLKALLDSGVLSAEEFEKEKTKILCVEIKKDQPLQAPSIQPKKQQSVLTDTQHGMTPKETESIACTSSKFHFLLCWTVIYLVAGAISMLIGNMMSNNGFWNVSVVYRKTYYLLLIICHVSNILPALAIKNKTYRIPCVIGVGLLSLYYIYETIQNMIQY